LDAPFNLFDKELFIFDSSGTRFEAIENEETDLKKESLFRKQWHD